MTYTQGLIKNSQHEINEYLKQVMKASVDNISVLRTKMDIHRIAIYTAKDIEYNEENSWCYKEITKMLDGIRGINGETPLTLIEEKLNILVNQLVFIRDVSEVKE